MTMSEPGQPTSLYYFFEGKEKGNEKLQRCLLGTKTDFKNWGHGYLHFLAAEIGQEYNQTDVSPQRLDELYGLVKELIPYFIENNAEPDAIDLLLEVEKLEDITKV